MCFANAGTPAHVAANGFVGGCMGRGPCPAHQVGRRRYQARRRFMRWLGDAYGLTCPAHCFAPTLWPGLLLVQGRTCVLKDMNGKECDLASPAAGGGRPVRVPVTGGRCIATRGLVRRVASLGRSTSYSAAELATLKSGETISVGSKFVEVRAAAAVPWPMPSGAMLTSRAAPGVGTLLQIQDAVSHDQYASGKFFLGEGATTNPTAAVAAAAAPAGMSSLRPQAPRCPISHCLWLQCLLPSRPTSTAGGRGRRVQVPAGRLSQRPGGRQVRAGATARPSRARRCGHGLPERRDGPSKRMPVRASAGKRQCAAMAWAHRPPTAVVA